MIVNASFEEADSSITPGHPLGWIVTTASTGEQTAAFEGDSSTVAVGNESFEHGWSLIDPQVLLQSLVIPAANSLPAETFEFWPQSVSFFALSNLVSAEFDGSTSTVETFSSWDAVGFEFVTAPNPLFVDSFNWVDVADSSDLTAAAFSGGETEDFDTGTDPANAWIQELTV